MNPMDVLPNQVKTCIEQLDYFIVEHSKSARKFIKSIAPEKKQNDLILFELNKHTQSEEIKEMIQPLLEGKNVGIISEAGCPGIADPGAIIVDLAHKKTFCYSFSWTKFHSTSSNGKWHEWTKLCF